jgi:hypothetical protein
MKRLEEDTFLQQADTTRHHTKAKDQATFTVQQHHTTDPMDLHPIDPLTPQTAADQLCHPTEPEQAEDHHILVHVTERQFQALTAHQREEQECAPTADNQSEQTHTCAQSATDD